MAVQELAYRRKARLRGKHRKVRMEQVFDPQNLIEAQREARRGKDTPRRRHKGVRAFDADAERYMQELADSLRHGTYHTSTPTVSDQMCPCGKERHLTKLPFYPDHIVHHALMRVIYPTMMRYYYYDSYASIQGKGMHFASRRVRRYIDENRNAGRLYWIKRDFVKFYHHIDQQRVYECLCRVFGDKGIRYLLREAVGVCDEGLGIGLFPIQPIVNLYTCELCRTVMSRCRVRVFIYCDDVLIIGRDKREVWRANAVVEEYVRDVMHQELHREVGMQVVSDKAPADFVGYLYYLHRTFIRSAMREKFERRMHNLVDALLRYQVACSYKGWLMHCDGFRLWCKVMGMKSFKELGVPAFEDVDPEGKRMLKGTRVSASIFVGREIIFRDAEIGVRSKFLKNGKEKKSTLIQVEEHGQLFKFFTDNQKLIRTIEYVKEHDGFPFLGTIVNTNLTGGLPDYEIQ